MRHIQAATVLLAGVLLGFAPGVRADSLQLKNGNLVQGRYLGGTERAVQFEANGRVQVYDVHQILSINFASTSADGGVPSNSAEARPRPRSKADLAAKQKTTPARAVRVQTKSKTDAGRIRYMVLRQNRGFDQPCKSVAAGWFRAVDERNANGNSLVQTWVFARLQHGISLTRN
jgi:hypothetical protein